MQVFIILITVLFNLKMCDFANHENVIGANEAIASFLGKQTGPTKVTSFLCWNNDKIVDLIKALNKHGIFAMNYNPAYKLKIPEYYAKEHLLYLLDMNCEFAIDILDLADRNYLFHYPLRWLLLEDCTKATDFRQFTMVLNSRVFTLNSCFTNNTKN